MSEDERLDQLLEGWSARQQLLPARAEAIRLAALSAPHELSPDWWRRILGDPGQVLRLLPIPVF